LLGRPGLLAGPLEGGRAATCVPGADDGFRKSTAWEKPEDDYGREPELEKSRYLVYFPVLS